MTTERQQQLAGITLNEKKELMSITFVPFIGLPSTALRSVTITANTDDELKAKIKNNYTALKKIDRENSLYYTVTKHSNLSKEMIAFLCKKYELKYDPSSEEFKTISMVAFLKKTMPKLGGVGEWEDPYRKDNRRQDRDIDWSSSGGPPQRYRDKDGYYH